MLKMRGKASEEDVLDRVKQLPENMKIEMLDFFGFFDPEKPEKRRTTGCKKGGISG